MKYTGSLAKKEREEIFRLFLNHDRLKFSDIEKAIKIRSNMVSYHIEQMQKEHLLEKKGEYYFLTASAEKYIPIFSHVTGQELGPLAVILVAVIHKGKILLIRRNKRPYKDYWSMIGGKILHSESIEDASIRIVKNKTGLAAKYLSTNSVFHERVVGDGTVKHSFLLFFTKVSVPDIRFKESESGILKWFDLKKLSGNDIIPSDYWLLRKKINKRCKIESAIMNEKDGRLSDFRLS